MASEARSRTMQINDIMLDMMRTGSYCPERLPPWAQAALKPYMRLGMTFDTFHHGDWRAITATLLTAAAAAVPPDLEAPLASDCRPLMAVAPYRSCANDYHRLPPLPPRRGDPPQAWINADAIFYAPEHWDHCHCRTEPDRWCPIASLACIAGGWQPFDLSTIPRGIVYEKGAFALNPEDNAVLAKLQEKWYDKGYLTHSPELLLASPAFVAFRIKMLLDKLPEPDKPLIDRVIAAMPAALERLKAWAPSGSKDSFLKAMYGTLAEFTPRMVADCSQRANDSIPEWRARFEHPISILVAMTQGCSMATRDFKGAFQHIRMAEHIRKYLGFKDKDGRIFVFDGAPMGLKTSCAAFSAISALVKELCVARGMDPRVVLVIYIDDVTFIGPDDDAVKAAMAVFHAVCANLGLHIDMTDPKNTSPSTLAVALGLQFNSVAMTVGLPPDKQAVRAFDTFILELCMLHHIPVPKSFLESYAGKMTYLSMIYPQLRPAARALHAVAAWESPLLHLWQDNHSVLRTLRAAIPVFAAAFRAGPLRTQRRIPTGPRPVIRLSSDASGDEGWGARIGDFAFWGTWTAAQASLSIAYKELWPLYCLLLRFTSGRAEHDWRGQIVRLETDNKGNVYNICSYAANGDAADLMARIIDVCAAHDIFLCAAWLPREHNTFCDALSKCRTLSAARAICRSSGTALRVIRAEPADT